MIHSEYVGASINLVRKQSLFFTTLTHTCLCYKVEKTFVIVAKKCLSPTGHKFVTQQLHQHSAPRPSTVFVTVCHKSNLPLLSATKFMEAPFNSNDSPHTRIDVLEMFLYNNLFGGFRTSHHTEI